MSKIVVRNSDGDSYELRQNQNDYVELITAEKRVYITPENLKELIEENNDGIQF